VDILLHNPQSGHSVEVTLFDGEATMHSFHKRVGVGLGHDGFILRDFSRCQAVECRVAFPLPDGCDV